MIKPDTHYAWTAIGCADWGYDKRKDAKKYRCPLKCDRIQTCRCLEKCSQSSYGRTIYIKTEASFRFHPRIPQGSDE